MATIQATMSHVADRCSDHRADRDILYLAEEKSGNRGSSQ